MDRLSQNPTIAPATSEIPLRKFHPTSSIRPFSLWIYGKLLRTFPQPPQARRRLTTFDQDLTLLMGGGAPEPCIRVVGWNQ